MKNNRYIVIMAGGQGERFWPKSRLTSPKHILPIVGETPMLAQTLSRLKGLVPVENIFVITNKVQMKMVESICSALTHSQIITEPIGRDTTAAIGLANILVKRKNPQAVFAVLPADHVVHDEEGFRDCINKAFDIASEREALVTIGIQPSGPSTAYGYIKKGELENAREGEVFYKVEQFVEKPDLETAKKYIASGQYFWNAGMFVWSVSTLEKALVEHCPEIVKGLAQLEERWGSGDSLEAVLDEIYPQLPKISIDYALMEKANNVYTVPSSFDWDDVGEWPAIVRHSKLDGEGNVIQGAGIVEKSSGNLIVGDPGHLITLLGVHDLIVVQTKDATLVCHKDKAQDIKKLVQKVKEVPDHSHLV